MRLLVALPAAHKKRRLLDAADLPFRTFFIISDDWLLIVKSYVRRKFAQTFSSPFGYNSSKLDHECWRSHPQHTTHHSVK